MTKIASRRSGITRNMLRLATTRGKTFDPPHGVDSPEFCLLGKDYWHGYPYRDYNYSYNSWGFRGEDYDQYIGQRVNICIGDSMTCNIGGPVEHSWPAQLAKYYDIPTLNMGMNGACFHNFMEYYEKSKEHFTIERVFVLYNLYDNEETTPTPKFVPHVDINTKINILKKHCWLIGAYWAFDPPWTWHTDELKCLYEHFPTAHDYMAGVQIKSGDVDLDMLVNNESGYQKYQEVAGSSWMPYRDFCQLVASGQPILEKFPLDVDKKLVKMLLNKHFQNYFYCNRDGWHMSQQCNAALASYFYQQASQNLTM